MCMSNSQHDSLPMRLSNPHGDCMPMVAQTLLKSVHASPRWRACMPWLYDAQTKIWKAEKPSGTSFRRTFQGREYSIWDKNRWKVRRKDVPDSFSAFQNLRLGSMDLPGCSPARVKERKCNPVLKSVNGDCYTSRTNNMISCRCACRPHMIACRCACLTHSMIACRIAWWCSCQTHTVIWYHADVSVEITTWYCFIVM
jgi:hypothetical protein